jgi:3-dehydroquinate dehydratase / shikimate dehydrogenase
VLQAVFSIDWSVFRGMSVFGQGLARICAVVAAPGAREFQRLVRAALLETPTVELRLDWLANDRERQKALQWLKRSAPKRAVFIATCRRRVGGGKFNGSAAKELLWLRQAKEAGCLWCDLEVETLRELPCKTVAGCELPRVLLSIHDFKKTPKSFTRMQVLPSRGVDAVKVAALSRTLSDSTRLLRYARGKEKVIAVPMGEIGLPARILGLRQGSALLYAPVGEETAPGQVALREMKQLYRAHELTKKTCVYGVIGNPIAHSLSPLLHNTGYVAARKDAVFVPFLVEKLEEFLKIVPDFDIGGFSVTIPHKQRIFDYLESCEALAEEIGAVNTVTVRRDGKLVGSNTDYLGVLRTLEGKLGINGSRVLIFGAGGSARAAAFASAKSGAEVLVCARRENAARQLARAVRGGVCKRAALRKEKFDAIVNTTPVGMHPHEETSPLEAAELNCKLVMDLIYRPLKTKLLRIAEARGIQTVSGVEMFLAQGIAQWELWMGSRAPEAPMRAAILKALRPRKKAGDRK